MADTVAEIRREHGVVLNSLGIEKPEEWFGEGKDGFKGQVVAHLLLRAVHRAALVGCRRADLLRLIDVTEIE
ncbi:hypothetical protein [Streptomyces sp. NPDC001843]|uniref:hypothetical protein n=1 Tax=Streptomyces sp. NPDC001843 TaxID=3364617 RepID=UPI00368A9AF2